MIKPRLAANWSEEYLFPKHAPLGWAREADDWKSHTKS
jgi:hypothetical protein